VDENGIPNAQPNVWGLPFGDKFGQFFVFYDWASHHAIQNVISTNMQITNGMTYGTIDRLKDFDKLEEEGIVEYI
jgi:hypothetical protein